MIGNIILDDYVDTPTDPAAREAFKQWYEQLLPLLGLYQCTFVAGGIFRPHVFGWPVQDHDLGDEDEGSQRQ